MESQTRCLQLGNLEEPSGSGPDIVFSNTSYFLLLKKKICMFYCLKERDPLHLRKVLVLLCRVPYQTLSLLCSVLIDSFGWQIHYFLPCLGRDKGKVICVNFSMQINKVSQHPAILSHSSFLI